MMQNCKSIILAALGCSVLLLCHCSTVSTTHPLATKPKAIDKQKFEGVWRIDDDAVLQIKFAKDGIARIAGTEWENDQFTLVRGEMHVVEGKEHNFLSVRFEEDGEWEENYLFAAYKFSEQGDLIFWSPNASEFKKAVEKKLLNTETSIEKEAKSKPAAKKSSSSIVITNPAAPWL